MTISVIIPTRNRPGFLRRALASVRAQTRVPDQVIIVNDGVEPIMLDGVDALRVGPGAGACIARNAGAALADGTWLAFLDDDDCWAPEYLEEAEALGDGVELVLTAFMKVRGVNGAVPEKVPPSCLDAQDLLVRNRGLRGSNLFIRRDRFLSLRGFDETLSAAQDLDLAVRLADAGVVHRVNTRPRVVFHAHDGARISSPGALNAFGNRGYLARHGRRMTEAQVVAFRERTLALFGSDPGPVPTLVWVLGPCGAGKTTWANRLAAREEARVLELSSLLEWRDGASLGVGTAKRALVSAVREVELRRPRDGRRLFVVAAHLPPEALAPLSAREFLVALVPRHQDWAARVWGRDGVLPASHQEDYRWWTERYGVGVDAAYRAYVEAA